jgi:hypothetical protein
MINTAIIQPNSKNGKADTALPTGLGSNNSNRAVLGLLEKYQKDRLHFVQTVAEQALRDTNVDTLVQNSAILLLKPLLSDPVPSIQQSAAVAIGRLANHRSDIATEIINSGIMVQLVSSLEKQNVSLSFKYQNILIFACRDFTKRPPLLLFVLSLNILLNWHKLPWMWT